MKELFLGFLSKTLNMESDKLAEMLYKVGQDGKLSEDINENALTELLNLDAGRVETLRKNAGTPDAVLLENQYKRGQREALEGLEKAIKTKYDLSEDKKGTELIDALVSKVSTVKLDDEKVKMHPLFLSLQDRVAKEKEEVLSTYEQKIKDLESSYKRKDTFAQVGTKIKDYFDSLKPILPSDTNKAAFLRDEFVKQFDTLDYEILENGKILPIRDGKRIEDNHGNPIYLDNMVKDEVYRRYDVQQQDPKGGAGNQNGQGSRTSIPKTQEEYDTAIYNAKTREERIEIATAWSAANQNAA